MKKDSKNILVLTPRLPYPVLGGDKLRIYKVCEYLKKQGYKLTLLSFVENDKQEELAQNHKKKSIFEKVETVKLTKLQSYINSFFGIFSKKPLQISYYQSSKMQSLVNKEIKEGDYNITLTHLIRMAPYIPDDNNLKNVLEMTDAISLNYKRNKKSGGKGFKSLLYNFEIDRVRKYERECIKKFDSVVVVSEIDKEYLKKEFNDIDTSQVRVITNGVAEDFIDYKQEGYDSNEIIFIGNLRSHQNEDAILYFINEVYPLVKNKKPKIKLKVIGSGPSEKLKAFDGKNDIEVTGRVKSIIETAKSGALSVAPIRIGAGVQNKVLESMAMGIPVVTTPVGAEGIDNLKNGENIFIADSSEDFAESVLKLSNKKELRDSLSSKGKELIRKNYKWTSRLEDYLEVL